MSMLTSKHYMNIALEFRVATGIASFYVNASNNQPIMEPLQRLSDDMLVNEIVLDSIEWGEYEEIRLDVLAMEKQMRKNAKELTIYKRVLELEEEEDE